MTARVRYDPFVYRPHRTRVAHTSRTGFGPCDRFRKGDLIRHRGRLRKIRAVRRRPRDLTIADVVVVKLSRSGYPTPITHLARYELRKAAIVRRAVDLYATKTESLLQVAVDRQQRALDNDGDFHIEDHVTEDDVVGVLA